MLMITLLIISLLIFLAYNALYLSILGLPTSLSETYYHIGKTFSVMMLIVTSTLLPVLFNCTPEQFKWLTFLYCAALMFVGAAPNYLKGDVEGKVHVIGACIAIVCAMSWIICCGYWWIVTIGVLLSAFCIFFFFIKEFVYVIYIIMFFS